MTLRNLVMLAAITYTLVIGGGLLFYRYFIAYPQLEEIALKAHKTDFRVIESNYKIERTTLSYLNLDWAKWDDAYEYARKPSTNFIDRNIQSASFIKSNIDIVSIFDGKKRHLYTGIKQGKSFIKKDSLADLTTDINIDEIFQNDENSGLVRVNNKLGFFSSHSIQDSKETKKSNGQLIFIQIFSKEFSERIQKLTNSQIEISLHSDKKSELSQEIDIDKINQINQISQTYTFELINHIKMPIGSIRIDFPVAQLPKPLDTITIISISILLLLPLLITVVVYLLFLKPMTFIFNNIGLMNKTGELNEINTQTYISEIDNFTSNFNSFIHQIKDYQSKLVIDSNTDGLTSLYNRRYFDKKYDELWRISIRSNTTIAIIMMDIDFFKRYNDHYGHQKGDDALKLVANALTKNTRRANETLARFGGEEFILVVEAITEAELLSLLNSILTSISDLQIEHCKSDIHPYLSLSCGACYIEHSGLWMKDLKEPALKIADDALYAAKENGRNQYVIRPLNENI